ncbi:unnamed protein product [Ectocarpus sp. 12 AP-2014]
MVLTDRDGLVALLHSTGGVNWIGRYGWDTAAELATWSGVLVNDEGRVVKLLQGSNNLQEHRAHLPSRTHSPSRTSFNVSRCSCCAGAIPEELGALTQLEKLLLVNNDLIGKEA